MARKQKAELKILYLQIRDDAETREEELLEFVRFSGLSRDQFTVLNVFDTPRFEPDVMRGHDALFVGGSSDSSVLEPGKYPFVEDSKRLLIYCDERSIPVFASCFGFQAATEALGGNIILDKDRMEMGRYEITLTDEMKDDPLFRDTPHTFWAVSGHKERAERLPASSVAMASSPRCPYHGFKLIGKPFYAFQFHPEVDKHDLIARIIRYKERYLDDDGQLQKIIDTAVETPEANALVHKFIDRIVLG